MARSIQRLVRILALAGTVSAAFSQTPDVWMKLFDGKDLTGWQGRTGGYWVVDSAGVIVGTHPTAAAAMNGENTFLFTDSMFSDFRLKLDGRMPGSGGYRNSGIMYRSTIVNKTGYAASGYQYEISDGGTGAFYHERGTELGFTGGCSGAGLTANDFKKMEIIADGPHATHLMNGKSCFDYKTFKVVTKGYIGLQLHAPGDFIVNFKNIYIQPLNNSFQIPANNAWDSTGKQIGITGIHITPKLKRANQYLGLPNSILGYDARGREIPATPADLNAMGSAFRVGRGAPGLYIRAD
ncbi:MAG: hypothetical protein JWO30_3253 [Fibrobacteres bacterium]|nr:hypothetical protein [Fibrobacterota bacterium]